MAAYDYGQYYWCVKVSSDISQDGEIYLNADDVTVTPSGALEFTRHGDNKNRVNLTIAPGKWFVFFVASCLDGSAVAVEYWKGEIVNSYEDLIDIKSHSPEKERGKMSKSLRYDVLRRDGFRCRSCGVSANEAQLTIDHITPVSKGGKTEISNLQSLCQDCNNGKRDKL